MKKSKFGIVVCKAIGSPLKNIGDYMQSLAALQFVPKESAIYIERELLDEFESDEDVPTIMNGWFMINPKKFPPSRSIKPCFISFHITPKIEHSFFTKETIEYLKAHEPIGCRDTDTVRLLNRYGVRGYFSGCLTLTLGNTYRVANRENKKIYIVDPYCDKIFDYDFFGSLKRIFVLFKSFVSHRSVIRRMSKRIKERTFLYKNCFNRLLYATKIYSTYSTVIDDDVLCNAIYEEQRISQSLFNSEEDKIKYAEGLLRKYGNAKFVITSRIHCALPCLALETPVVFVSSNNMERKIRPTRPSGRLGGLIDLFKNMYVVDGRLVPDLHDFHRKTRIGMNFEFENKKDFEKYKEVLERECKKFVSMYR